MTLLLFRFLLSPLPPSIKEQFPLLSAVPYTCASISQLFHWTQYFGLVLKYESISRHRLHLSYRGLHPNFQLPIAYTQPGISWVPNSVGSEMNSLTFTLLSPQRQTCLSLF